MLKIIRYTTRIFQENIYVIYDEETRETVIVDPGMMSQQENEDIYKIIDEFNLIVKRILLTHAHIDHACGASYIASKYGVEVFGNIGDENLSQMLPLQAEMFQLNISVEALKIDNYLNDKDSIPLGSEEIIVLSTPGHSLGGLSYYIPKLNCVFAGDSLFQGSVGRTDLWGGNHRQLINSISDKLMTLPDDTIVYCGHGPETTIGEERNNNPYI